MPTWVGRSLGNVSVELLLARGGIADVYLGRHSTLHRSVVIKVLNAQFAEDPDLLERFQREARVVAMLRHPNIVQVHDFDTVDAHPYIVMEYVPGISLATYLRSLRARGQRLDLRQVSALISPIAGALQYAHGLGAIHRDVKPGNILLTSPTGPIEEGKPLPSDVNPVLADFSLVRFENPTHQTSSGRIAGTPAYMSPEQAAGLPVDSRTDVYSLGIVLYELLAGRVPFEADSTMELLRKQVDEEPPSVPNLSAPLQSILGRALAKDPTDRYATPSDLAAALRAASEAVAEASTLRDTPTAYAEPQAAHAPRKPSWSWLTSGFVAIAIIVLAALLGVGSVFSRKNPSSSYGAMDMSSPSANGAVAGAETPIGVLRFQDGSAHVDKVTFSASNMPAPASGKQYEVWMVAETGEELRALGYLKLDSQGTGSATFVDPQGRNLLSLYNRVEITLEPNPDSSPNPAQEIAYSAQLPAEGLMHVRHLLVAFGNTPGGAPLAEGLLQDTALIDDAAQRMLTAFQASDAAGTMTQAEAILSVLVGSQSADHKDWNGDGLVTDPGDGYGLLLNGDNTGYIQGAYSHADYAATSPGATNNMKLHGEHVKICSQNLAEWAPQLRDLAKQILSSPFGPDNGPAIRQAVALADEMLKGTDLNGNERIEPIPGEGGAQTAYQHAFYMADIVISLQK